jgi:transposase
MGCATISGIGSRIFCPAAKAVWEVLRRITDLFVEAVLFRFRAGVPWRDLPERFGNWKIVYQRFNRWSKSGVFERIFKLLASDHDNEYMMIDATIVRAHQHSAGAQKKTANKRSADPAAD